MSASPDFQQGVEQLLHFGFLRENLDFGVFAEQVAGKEVLVLAEALDLGQRDTSNTHAPEFPFQGLHNIGRDNCHNILEVHDFLLVFRSSTHDTPSSLKAKVAQY